MRFRFLEFEFDSRRHQLTRGGTPVSLTPKAVALLEVLIAEAPEAVSKETLYDRLWEDVVVEPGNLHNLISEVRRAFGDDQHRIIRTVHRVGYAFAESVTREGSFGPQLEVGNAIITLTEGENIIGREILGTPDASRQHARIEVRGTEIAIEDLDSKNGTFVNGERIHERTPLRDGDRIAFGRTQAKLRMIDAAAPTATAPR